MPKKKIIGYIPTVDKKPARWSSDGQLCYCDNDSWKDDDPFNVHIYKSKKYVKTLIQKSINYRKSNGNPVNKNEYGYFTVERIIN